ncbi:MAG TPA: multidrug efflux RND transporter permease subunit [Polyangia bacterium]|nr:multidrug efflux RND transporter permease subunit [Polyangia bacterium]
MNISAPFIRHPVATTLLTIGLLLAGITGYRALPVSTLPEVDYPTIQVTTFLPGASAETMASAVTTPLERQFGQMPSLGLMTSTSSFGTSLIALQFQLDRNIDAAEQDVQAAINAAATFLPPTLPSPPVYSKSNPADTPILTLAVTSKTLPLAQVDDVADSILAQKIAQVSGVGLVSINGSQKPAVRVEADPVALSGVGLSLEDLRTTLALANVNQPKGNLDGPRLDYTIATNDQVYKAAGFRPLILAYRNDSPIRLDDVADVSDGVENALLAGWADREPAIILNVWRQPGANVIATADRVKALLPTLHASLPRSLAVRTLSDRTETVRASVHDVQETLVITVVLVVAVIFIFLGSVRATLIPGVAVPLSLVATFGVMYLCGYSLDNLSLMALTISTGFVVDDAIVMVENISRHVEEGMAPLPAALEGARQIGFTIVSLTVSLVAVLIPLLFMRGIIGRLFREFAVTLSIAIGVSALLSLTLTAMMSAHLLRPAGEARRRGRLSAWCDTGFRKTTQLYERTLGWVLDHQLLMLAVTIATLLLTGILALVVPKGFFPQQDTGLLQGISEAPATTSFARMSELQLALVDVVRGDPDVASVASFIGADGTNLTPNSGRMLITLKPRSERHAGAAAIIARLQPKVARVEGIKLYLQAVQDLQIDTRVSRTQYQLTLDDADAAELHAWSPRAVARLARLRELREVSSDERLGGATLVVTVDRDTAYRLGLSVQAIDDTLYDAFGQRIVSTIFTQLNQYRVILTVKPEYQNDPKALERIFVRTPAGDQVPLSAVAHVHAARAPLAIDHQGQFTAVNVSFDLAQGTSLGAAVKAIDRALAELGVPRGIHVTFAGTAAAFRDSLASEPWLLLAALVTVYIVLGVLYESYIHPITILSTLPSAGVGALLALILLQVDFSIIALIGVILLIGIVKKNAIMMIDFALSAERGEGLPPREAIYQACRLRFRPIMMTTMAALLGGLPLAIGSGTGSELRRPLGITIIGGLLVSQLLTLYTTPVVYLYMERLARRFRREPRP